MMANRPLHLRWIYVKDHWPLFVALAASLGVVIVALIVTTEDPTRGLALGALPAIILMAAWTLTNRAGYVDRTPDTLPHERPAVPAEPDVHPHKAELSPAVDGDPFAEQPETLTPAQANLRRWRKAETPSQGHESIASQTKTAQPEHSVSPTGAATPSAEGRKSKPEKRDGNPDAVA